MQGDDRYPQREDGRAGLNAATKGVFFGWVWMATGALRGRLILWLQSRMVGSIDVILMTKRHRGL